MRRLPILAALCLAPGVAVTVCVQAALAEGFEGSLGPRIGWKVDLTSAPQQQAQFGVDHPVAGQLFEPMLLPDGAVVPAPWG